MGEKKQARLVERGRNELNGGTYETWDIGDGRGIYVDFNAHICETMAFPLDLRKNAVTSWAEMGCWPSDATGGKAIRELGYEPIEEDS